MPNQRTMHCDELSITYFFYPFLLPIENPNLHCQKLFRLQIENNGFISSKSIRKTVKFQTFSRFFLAFTRKRFVYGIDVKNSVFCLLKLVQVRSFFVPRSTSQFNQLLLPFHDFGAKWRARQFFPLFSNQSF